MQKNTSPEIRELAKYMKRQLVFSRIIGLLFCLSCAGALALMYIGYLDEWTSMVVVSFSLAAIFMANSYLQGIKSSKKWQMTNMVLAIFCYCAVVVFVVLGFTQGTIKFGI